MPFRCASSASSRTSAISVTLIIGDGTALIGDPSGRNSTRPQLTREQIAANAQTYVDQAFKILDPEKTTLRYNSEWILDLEHGGPAQAASATSRLLAFSSATTSTSVTQAVCPSRCTSSCYPVMQAYDSVVIKADVEIGGSDQLFNLLAGRELMEKMGMEPQVCPDASASRGHRRRAARCRRATATTSASPTSPRDMFGKVMSIPDELMPRVLPSGDPRFPSPRSTRSSADLPGRASSIPTSSSAVLAREIVAALPRRAGRVPRQKTQFDRVFKEHAGARGHRDLRGRARPNDPENGGVYLPKLLADVKLASSNGEGRRLIDGGGVKVTEKPFPPRRTTCRQTSCVAPSSRSASASSRDSHKASGANILGPRAHRRWPV